MGTKATYIDSRSGKPCNTPVFGTRAMAEGYMKNIKGAKDVTYVDTATEACAKVTAVDEGTAEKQRDASKAFYAPIKAARQGIVIEKPERRSAEHDAEQDMETYGAAYAATGSSDAAMEELNYVRANR